ncbi:hypothetical protein BHM03_00021875 [Ensete ventricosum]|nr:hypothetical protein BHM03_00021875 [Ensete ventricosum]
MMWLGTRLECVGSSLRVSGACQDGAREFAGRRRRLVGRLSGVAERLVGNDGLRSSLDIGPSSDDAVGPHWEFARRSAEGNKSSLGTRRVSPEEDRKTYRKNVGSYRISGSFEIKHFTYDIAYLLI